MRFAELSGGMMDIIKILHARLNTKTVRIDVSISIAERPAVRQHATILLRITQTTYVFAKWEEDFVENSCFSRKNKEKRYLTRDRRYNFIRF